MKPQRILVVDDEEPVREVIGRRLAREGHRVQGAADGAQAWEAFQRDGFDVVITDLNMPRLGGMELIRRVKESAAQTVTIVLTGYGTLDSAVEALRCGCDDYLLKPLQNLDMVTHAVERSLSCRDAALLAASARRVSEAKDGVLSVVIEELEARLDDIGALADRLLAPSAEPGPAAAAELASGLQAQLARLAAVLKDVKLAHHMIRERNPAAGLRPLEAPTTENR